MVPSSSSGRASTPPRTSKGTTLASPQLGNTQDVALRTWLTEEGLENSIEGGGDVTIAPTANADTLNLFQAGDLDGAWLPEPWASRLVLEAGGHVLVDERDLWPDGEFVTTHLIVRTEFLEQYPETVAALLRGHVAAVELADRRRRRRQDRGQRGPGGGRRLRRSTPRCSTAPGANLTVTYDPIASALKESAENGFDAGTTEEVDLDGIYDLRPLNADPRRPGPRPGLGRRPGRGVTDRVPADGPTRSAT